VARFDVYQTPATALFDPMGGAIAEVPVPPGALDVGDENRPLVIATILRQDGFTGVHTHVRRFMQYLGDRGIQTTLITPWSREPLLSAIVFAVRLGLVRISRAASVMWYRGWHEAFLRRGLQLHLAGLGEAVVYAQGPLEASAALAAREGPHQRVVMAVHFHASQADEWVGKKCIKPDKAVFRSIRRFEKSVIPRVDGLMFVSESARDALLSWLPEAHFLPSAVIPGFVEIRETEKESVPERLGDLVTVGGLEINKNQRFIIEVVAEAKRMGRTLTLDLFGEGPCSKDLVRQAKSLGVDDQLRFRGFVPNVCDMLPGYRVYVHASLSETGPLAIIEAIAAGVPVVAGSVGGIPELYEAGIGGNFWPLDDPARGAAILIDILDSEATRRDAVTASLVARRRSYDSSLRVPQLWSFLTDTTGPPTITEMTGSNNPLLEAEPIVVHEQSLASEPAVLPGSS
jgi:glycosyltransferase involved in cell wall biosynthesis